MRFGLVIGATAADLNTTMADCHVPNIDYSVHQYEIHL
jgi:hypothetical protein